MGLQPSLPLLLAVFHAKIPIEKAQSGKDASESQKRGQDERIGATHVDPDQGRGHQKEYESNELSSPGPEGVGVFLVLKVRMNNDQQRRMCQALRVVNFTAEVREGLHLHFAELLGCVHAVKHKAGGIGGSGVRFAIGRQGSGGRPVLQKDDALGGADEVSPIPRVASRIKEPDLVIAAHITPNFHSRLPRSGQCGVPDGTGGDDGLTSMPLIIPPVKEKTYNLFGQLFNLLWREAEDALAAADSIVVIGYSFRDTDLQSSNLFCNAFLRRQTMPKVHIVDPAPERVTGKFQN